MATQRVSGARLSLGVVAALSAAAALGCSTPKVSLAEGPREYVATDYSGVLRSWTRSKQFTNVSVMDNVLSVTATYESWDFRWAYVVRYAEDYRLTIDQRHSLLERSLADARENHQFYVALYAQRHRWADLNAKDPAWIVRLIDDEGTETAPSNIEQIRKPGAIELTYFPYTTPWRSAFRVTFPRVRADGRPTIAQASRWFGLRFAGAQGYEEIVWELGSARAANNANPVLSPPKAPTVAAR
ncbi:MAG TPA: hypothetical protein VIW29_06870 [Polyangiaceae bacterium]